MLKSGTNNLSMLSVEPFLHGSFSFFFFFVKYTLIGQVFMFKKICNTRIPLCGEFSQTRRLFGVHSTSPGPRISLGGCCCYDLREIKEYERKIVSKFNFFSVSNSYINKVMHFSCKKILDSYTAKKLNTFVN